jgi:hypothetical protein
VSEGARAFGPGDGGRKGIGKRVIEQVKKFIGQ